MRGPFTPYAHTLTVVQVDNDGNPNDALVEVRDLLRVRVSGWTESPGTGYWHGKPEPVTVITVYSADPDLPRTLAAVGRLAMPDQETIQVTRSQSTTQLWEG